MGVDVAVCNVYNAQLQTHIHTQPTEMSVGGCDLITLNPTPALSMESAKFDFVGTDFRRK
jgi:hypothetical protein